jgi:hypothetical protein
MVKINARPVRTVPIRIILESLDVIFFGGAVD